MRQERPAAGESLERRQVEDRGLRPDHLRVPGRLPVQATSSRVRKRSLSMMVQYTDGEMLDATREVVNQISHDVRGIARLQPSIASRVVRIAVEAWPPIVPLPYPIVGKESHHEAIRLTRAKIRRQYEEQYGMGVIATILLSAIIQQVVAAILRRWWDNRGEFRRQMRLAQVGFKQ
jgi:hypothetical protein